MPPSPRPPPGELAARQINFARQHGWVALGRKLLVPPRVIEFDFTPYSRAAPDNESYWPTLRECTVFLGVNRYPSLRFPYDRPGSYSRLRDIEAPMAGACYLTEWTEGLGQLYELSVEIETYRTAGELVEQARALAADAPRRKRLRLAGQKRALHDHSIPRTLELIAARLDIAR